MPVMYLCKRCGKVIEKRGYCEEHKHLEKKFSYQNNKVRYNHHSLYNTMEWRKLRKRILERDNHSCVQCGVSVPRMQVDHIISHQGNEYLFLDEMNLQTLCPRCHGLKCAQESSVKGHNNKQNR